MIKTRTGLSEPPFSATKLCTVPPFSAASPAPTSSAPTSLPCPHHHGCEPLAWGSFRRSCAQAGLGFRGPPWCITWTVLPEISSQGRFWALPASRAFSWNLAAVAAIPAPVETKHSVREKALRQKPLLAAGGTPTEARVLVLRTFSLQQLIKRCQAI